MAKNRVFLVILFFITKYKISCFLFMAVAVTDSDPRVHVARKKGVFREGGEERDCSHQ